MSNRASKIPTIKYDSKIEESCIFLGEHENEICKRLDSLTLEKPIFLVRKNPQTLEEEGLPLTKNLLTFLKENKREYSNNFDYDIYIDYSFHQVDTIEEIGIQEDILYYKPITEEYFMKNEKAWWQHTLSEKEKETINELMGAIKSFHNTKWHNGENFWK